MEDSPLTDSELIEKPLLEDPYVNQFVRPNNTIAAGIVGLPNSGKTSLFNLLTGEAAMTDSNLFCTVDPNMATVDVPDARQAFIRQAFGASSAVGCALTVIDSAGIVEGSHQGRGLGNGTLSHLERADVLFHIVRAFDNDTLSHYEETIDAVRDIRVVDQQLIERDLQTCVAAIEAIEEDVVRGFGGLSDEFRFETLLAMFALLAGRPYTYRPFAGSIAKKQPKVDQPVEGIPLRYKTWTQSELDIVQDLHFLTAKEMIYLVNLSMRNYLRPQNRWMPPIEQFLMQRRAYYRPDAPPVAHPAQAGIFSFSIDFENRYRAACLESDGAEEEYLRANVTHASRLPLLMAMPRHLLGWLRVYTASEREVESYFIPKGVLAPVAGGYIKTEFERYFLSVDVLSYYDLEEMRTAFDAIRALKFRQQGTLYTVVESDIMVYKIKS